MAYGPGVYDNETTELRQKMEATAVILVVIDGVRGSGFSMQGPPRFTLALPQILRNMADQIERDST